MLQQYDERNRDLVVGIDDTLVHRDRAGISPFDSVVQGGDAVWEGLRLHRGRIFKLTEHLARLRRSAHALAFTEIPAAEVLERPRAVELLDVALLDLPGQRGRRVAGRGVCEPVRLSGMQADRPLRRVARGRTASPRRCATAAGAAWERDGAPGARHRAGAARPLSVSRHPLASRHARQAAGRSRRCAAARVCPSPAP